MTFGCTQVNGQTAGMTQFGKLSCRAAPWKGSAGPARTDAAAPGGTLRRKPESGLCDRFGAACGRSSARLAQLCAGATGTGERPFAKGRLFGLVIP